MAGAWQQVGGEGGTEVAAAPCGEEGMGGKGAQGVLAGADGWEGGARLPTIEEVTMSMKYMLSGSEGLGGPRGQSFMCPHSPPPPPTSPHSSPLCDLLSPPALWPLSAPILPALGF